MTTRIQRRGDSVLKRVAEGCSGRRVAAWSRHLSTHGVSTPPARYDSRTNSLRLPWIAGTAGRDLLAHSLAGGASSGETLRTPDLLQRLLAPLVRLHRIGSADLDLEPIDPWRRVRPRLAALAAAPPDSRACRIAERAHDLVTELERRTPAPVTGSLVHGDLHVGQLIIDGNGQPWLLDLDDLAAGPPEADVGNFVAHLCTKEPFAGPQILDDVTRYVRLASAAYVAGGGAELLPDRLHWYAAAALIRRALKLLETGPDPLSSETALAGSNHCLHVSRVP